MFVYVCWCVYSNVLGIHISLDLNGWADAVTSIRLDKAIKVWIGGCLWCNCMGVGGIGRHHDRSTRTLYCCWGGRGCRIPACLIWPTHSILVVIGCRMLWWRRSINHGCDKWRWRWCCSCTCSSRIGTIIWAMISRRRWWARWTISFIRIFTTCWWCWRRSIKHCKWSTLVIVIFECNIPNAFPVGVMASLVAWKGSLASEWFATVDKIAYIRSFASVCTSMTSQWRWLQQ